MLKISLIGRRQYKYNDNITINIPTTNQIRGDNSDDENYFWGEISLFTKTPDEMISELDAMGVDFETLTDYSLFVMFSPFISRITKTKKRIYFFLQSICGI